MVLCLVLCKHNCQLKGTRVVNIAFSAGAVVIVTQKQDQFHPNMYLFICSTVNRISFLTVDYRPHVMDLTDIMFRRSAHTSCSNCSLHNEGFVNISVHVSLGKHNH